MDNIKLPELPETLVKGVVAIKSSDLKILVDAYNTLIGVVAAQQTTIQDLTSALDTCREDITKIAKILEELYET
jgi:hypothetical protein